MNPTKPTASCVYNAASLRRTSLVALCALSLASTCLGTKAWGLEVIAHRGAQAQRPENTLASEKLALQMGADWLECDLVVTKDQAVILSHDLYLEPTTDIATRFPTRAREDGHFYAIDFTLAELRTLAMRPRVEADGKRAFPDRKVDVTGAGITTLEEFLALPKGKFYIEMKSPQWQIKNGGDVSKLALEKLAAAKIPPARVWLQCFDAAELKRLRNELKSPYRQTQLLTATSKLLNPAGFVAIKKYADAIGPRLDSIFGKGETSFVAQAHKAGLQVHPYTFQTDRVPFMPPLTANWIDIFERVKVDALFTDQADEVLAILKARKKP